MKSVVEIVRSLPLLKEEFWHKDTFYRFSYSLHNSRQSVETSIFVIEGLLYCETISRYVKQELILDRRFCQKTIIPNECLTVNFILDIIYKAKKQMESIIDKGPS